MIGNGSKNNPYQVRTAADLRQVFQESYHYVYFTQMNDIDLGGEVWTPISTSDYLAYYEGNGKTISNFKIVIEDSNSAREFGLFKSLYNKDIKNLTLKNVEISFRSEFNSLHITYSIGSLAGRFQGSYGYLENFHVEDTVFTFSALHSQIYYGGISGTLDYSAMLYRCSLKNLNLERDISEDYIWPGELYIGGLFGYSTGIGIKECFVSNANLNIAGTLENVRPDNVFVGGLVGRHGHRELKIENSYAENVNIHIGNRLMQVKGHHIGSLVGANDYLIDIKNSYATGSITKNELLIAPFGFRVNTSRYYNGSESRYAIFSLVIEPGWVGTLTDPRGDTYVIDGGDGSTDSEPYWDDTMDGVVDDRILSSGTMGSIIEVDINLNEYGYLVEVLYRPGGWRDGRRNDLGGAFSAIHAMQAGTGASVNVALGILSQLGFSISTQRRNIVDQRIKADLVGADTRYVTDGTIKAVTVDSSYYLNQSHYVDVPGKGTPKTDSELRRKTTFEGWDFNSIWRIDDGKAYPRLRWQNVVKRLTAIPIRALGYRKII